MNENYVSKWKLGILAAIAITFLMLLPQLNLWLLTGSNWQGSYVLLHSDEVAYSAYINALIDGRDRRNDPYTGRDNKEDAPQAESLFSIQFIPAYCIALPARILGLSASSAFIWLTVISSFLSSLAIFWLIKSVTGDARLAAAGAIFVLCFGALAATYGEARVYFGDFLGQGAGLVAIPFTRRYQPSALFPLFFVFCGLVWQALTAERRRGAIVYTSAAGLSFAVLVFSYFYLWTAAAAWFACLVFLYSVFHWQDWKRNLALFLTIGAFAISALVPYLMLLSRRAKSLDEMQALTLSRSPDLFRFCEIAGFLIVLIIGYGVWRNIFNLKNHAVLFALSFALLPLIVFNQQIVTGVSLQPIHYELYVANYVVLIAIVFTSALITQEWLKQHFSRRTLMWLAVLALGWGFVEVTGLIKRDAEYMKIHEDGMVVAKRLTELSNSVEVKNANGERPSVLVTDIDQADLLPTSAPQAVLWAPHISVFAGLKAGEGKERFYQYLYFSGVSEKELVEVIRENKFEVMAAIFGYERALPALTANANPITSEEVRTEINRFSEYKSKFTREQAAQYNLAYVVTHADLEPNFSNLDRWYERDAGEQTGKWKLYRVKLRP